MLQTACPPHDNVPLKRWTRMLVIILTAAGLSAMAWFWSDPGPANAETSFPETAPTTWPVAEPEAHGLDAAALDELANLVEGAGFVVHKGKAVYRWGHDHRPRYVASVKKPLISVLMLQAVEQKLLKGLDEPVTRHEPQLAGLNNGMDAGITWRHLGGMLSGYGMADKPGEAFAYNDYAIALWYDTLMNKVYREDGTRVLNRQLATPLGFEDEATFLAFGNEGPEPKLRISARDLARVGQMILEGGAAFGNRVLEAASMREMLDSVVPVETPISTARQAAMIVGQKTVGGSYNISPIGPGRYSYHWWLNKRGPRGRLMLPDAPEDTILASGKWGEAALWIIPSLELVVAWNDSDIKDHHLARELSDARMNQAARLLLRAAGKGAE